jgi:AcrR family transcriptional regulator
MPRPAIYDQATRDALLVAAGRILAEEGAGLLTMRRLAAEVGATTSAIYALFGSKQEVVRAMFREGFEHLIRLEAEVDQSDPVERIRELAYAYRRAALEKPHLYQVMFACPVPDFSPDDEDDEVGRESLLILRDAVAEAVAAQAFHGDVDTITVGLWALVHGLTSLELNGSLGHQTDPQQVWDIALDAGLTGLKALRPSKI